MASIKGLLTLRNLAFVVSIIFFIELLQYFFTGAGGQRYLAVRLVPLALIIQVLLFYQERYFYPRLPKIINHLAVLSFIAISLYALVYLTTNYEDIAIDRKSVV